MPLLTLLMGVAILHIYQPNGIVLPINILWVGTLILRDSISLPMLELASMGGNKLWLLRFPD